MSDEILNLPGSLISFGEKCNLNPPNYNTFRRKKINN